MRNWLKLGLTAAALMVAGSAGARADLTVQNQSGKPVWFTLYNYLGSGITSGCLLPGNSVTPHIGGWLKQGMVTYVRGELKSGSDCGGKTASDTGKGPTISIGANTLKQFWQSNDRLFVK